MIVSRPRGRSVTVAAVSAPVVSLPDMKEQCRVSHADQDAFITSIEAAAVAWVERKIQRLLTVRQVVLKLPCLPTGKIPVELPYGRIASLVSVVADGTAIVGCTTEGDSPARLFPAADWPVVTGEILPVVITYTAGYASVPADIVTAIKLVGEAIYDGHDEGIESPAVMALLQQHRIKAL